MYYIKFNFTRQLVLLFLGIFLSLGVSAQESLFEYIGPRV